MIRKFVHIGYPKNFSTSLQNDFFAKHPDLFHLGIGPGLNYADPLIDATFEVYLKSAKGFKYNEVEPRLKKHFAAVIAKAEQSGKKALTLSSEHLSFSFANDSIGFDEKMKRLAGLMGSDTHILLIIRNQFDLIRSLYRESVRVGFPDSFAQYVYLLYKYQDRNFCYDFRYDLVIETLRSFFSSENIHLFCFESMRGPDGTLLNSNGKTELTSALCHELGVDYLETDFGHYNEALSDPVVIEMAELNKVQRHDLGNILYDTAEKHRMKYYLSEELGLHETEAELFGDVRIKRALIQQATESGGKGKINYTVLPEIEKALSEFYGKGNSRLEKLLGIQLPPNYFEMKF